MSSPNRTSTFNPSSNYEHVYVIGGRNAQDWAINELQRIRDYDRRRVNDQLFRRLAVLSGLSATPTSATGSIVFTSGVAYLLGRAMNVPSATVTGYPTSPGVGEIDTVYLQWLASQIGRSTDSTIADPYTGDPVEDRIAMAATLATTNPDILDESFETWQSGLPYNTPLSLGWTVTQGSASNFAIGYPPRGYQLQALQITSILGTPQAIQLTIPVAASTTYTFSMWVKTVYGQPDISTLGSAYAYAQITNITGGATLTQPFTTSGGATLLGGYQLVTFSFTTGTGTSSAITLATGSSCPSTRFLIDDLLITSSALTSGQLERHYYPLFTWTRSSNAVAAVNTPKSVLYLTDLTGPLPASDVSFTSGAGTASDITATTAQGVMDQLSTLRALTNGSSADAFNAATATTPTEVPPAAQVQQGSLTWAATSTNSGNAYTVALTPTPTLSVGMQIRFVASATSTGVATLTIGTSTFTIYRPDGSQSKAGDLVNGGIVTVTITSLSAPLTCQIYAPSAQYVTQPQTQNYAQDTGAANAYVVTLSPAPISITAGFPIRVLAANASTGASTLAVNGAAPVTIIRPDGSAIEESDIGAKGICDFVFDGTYWQLVSTPGSVLQVQQTYTAGAATRGNTHLGTSQSLSTTATTILTWSITLPSTGPGWIGHIHLHSFTQMLAPSNTTGTEIDVTWAIADNIGNSDQFGTQSDTSTVDNQVRKQHFNSAWITPQYSAGVTITFTISASYSLVTGSESVAPQAIAPTTWAQWVFVKAK